MYGGKQLRSLISPEEIASHLCANPVGHPACRTPRPQLEPTTTRKRLRTAPAITTARLWRRWRRRRRLWPSATTAALPPISHPAAAPPSQPPRTRFSQRAAQPRVVWRVAEPAAVRCTAWVYFSAVRGQPGGGGGRRLAREGFGGKSLSSESGDHSVARVILTDQWLTMT
jgi:hypothetical protein